MRRYGVAVAAVGVLALASGCGSSSSSDDAAVVEARGTAEGAGAVLARASESTSAVETGRIRVVYRYTGDADGEAIDAGMTAEGSFADFGKSMELTADMTPMIDAMGGGGFGGPESMVMRQIIVDTDLYLQMEMTPPVPEMPPGQWFRMDMSDALGGAGAGSVGGLGGMSGGPNGYLESLKAGGATVVEAGTDEIDGVPVTVYRGKLDPEDAVAAADPETADEVRRAFRESGMGTIPFTAFVDDDGMVRRLDMEMTMELYGLSMTVHMVMDLYDFGAPITVTPPPADQVVDEGFFGTAFEELGTA
ncbi:MAG TPA: hypothetical protein VIY72_15065 [Acidimicrobiales bacterium]